MKLPAVLSDSFLRCLSPADRKAIAGGQLSAEEALQQYEIRSERDLQKMIVARLRLKGIEPIWHATHKKSTANKGTPDILFTVQNTLAQAHAWELKFGTGELSIDQKQMFVRLSSPPNCWNCKVIRSGEDALRELRALGL